MSYGGDVTPTQCWEMLSTSDDVFLIDVRTQAEWTFVGMPLVSDKMAPAIGQQWQVYPEMMVDGAFGATLVGKLEGVGASKDAKLCFLCRSGVRSLAAAKTMTELGYPNTFNITHGFEGDPNENGHRGGKNGWKAEGLPWRQG